MNSQTLPLESLSDFDADPNFETTPDWFAVRADWLDVLPPEADCLRDYQADQLAKAAQALQAGYRRILVQAPTGSGKGHQIAAIAAAAARIDLPVIILVTRTRLVRQLDERLTQFGVRHGIIASSLQRKTDFSARVQVCSVDTLYRRAISGRQIPLPPASVVIFDESHLCTADTRLEILDRYPQAIRFGFTATPARKSGKSLGVAFETLILGRKPRELIDAGMLVPLRIFNTPVVTDKELKSVPKDNDNDYQNTSLAALLNRPKLIGDILENWLKIANGKRTLLFAVNKAHAASLLERFQQNGIAAEMLTDDDGEEAREEVIARLESGVTKVVINCFLMSYGTDIPSVECVVLGRPTRSLVMFLQMVGRGMRPCPETGKVDCILIDHGHCVENLGLPTGDFEWTLNPAVNVNREAIEQARKNTPEATRTCKECNALWLTSEQGNACPECGWKPAPRSKPVTVQKAELTELADAAEPVHAGDPRVVRFYQEALGYRQRHSPERWLTEPKKVRWACWCRVKERFEFPDTKPIPSMYWNLPALPCGIEVSGWMKSRDIKWARRRRAA